MAKLKDGLTEEYFAEPYEKSNDPLSRHELAEQLTTLYSNLEHGSVAILNGRWGSGKSVFAKKLLAHLRNRGISATYFDAFAKDYVESPFLALSGHIIQEIERSGNTSLTQSEEIRRTSKEVAKKLGSISAKVAVKALTLGIIGADEINGAQSIIRDISDGVGDVIGAAAENAIENYIKIEKDFEEFRKSLDGLSAALGRVRPDEVGNNPVERTVFIIDELDRCRPDFALGILEIIKHLFDNDNVHFLIVTNLEYLVSSVNSKYGLENSSYEYLEKFYDFVIYFERVPEDKYRHPASTLVSQKINAIIGPRHDRNTVDLIENLQAFVKAFDLSLRQASSLATNAALAFLVERPNGFRPSILIALLALYRTKFPAIYQSIKDGSYTSGQLLKVFENFKFDNRFLDEKLPLIIEFYASEDSEIDRRDPKYAGYSDIQIRFNFHTFREVLPYLVNSVMDNFGAH